MEQRFWLFEFLMSPRLEMDSSVFEAILEDLMVGQGEKKSWLFGLHHSCQ